MLFFHATHRDFEPEELLLALAFFHRLSFDEKYRDFESEELLFRT